MLKAPKGAFCYNDDMKVTKLVHSCLLVEHGNQRVLVDPGNYSWQSGVVNDDHLQNLNAVVVTHVHPDHLNQDFVDAIKGNSPIAKWYGTQEVANQLEIWGVKASLVSDDTSVRFIESRHADLSPWFSQQPEHTSYVLFDELLVGGDCHSLTEAHGARIFAAAINGGPWGAVVGFAKMIELMTARPQVVLPLHDWHWNETARAGIYQQLPDVLEKFEVKFVPLVNGTATEV